MTPCKRRVIRLTSVPSQYGKPYVLRINEGGKTVSIKVKGSRTWFTVTTQQIWTMGAWNRAAELKAERAEKRKKK